MTPVEIARVHVARKTPWRHQARGPLWLDCIGLAVEAYAAWGIQDITDYPQTPNDNRLERLVRKQFGPPVPKESMRANDLVLIGLPTVVRHVGIVADHQFGGLSLIHTSGSTRFVTEHKIDKTWRRMIKIVHRMPEL